MIKRSLPHGHVHCPVFFSPTLILSFGVSQTTNQWVMSYLLNTDIQYNNNKKKKTLSKVVHKCINKGEMSLLRKYMLLLVNGWMQNNKRYNLENGFYGAISFQPYGHIGVHWPTLSDHQVFIISEERMLSSVTRI